MVKIILATTKTKRLAYKFLTHVIPSWSNVRKNVYLFRTGVTGETGTSLVVSRQHRDSFTLDDSSPAARQRVG